MLGLAYNVCFVAMFGVLLSASGCAHAPKRTVASSLAKTQASNTQAGQSEDGVFAPKLKEVACGKADCGCQGKEVDALSKRGARRVVFRVGAINGGHLRITAPSKRGSGVGYGSGPTRSSDVLSVKYRCFRADLPPGDYALSASMSDERGAFLELAEVTVEDGAGALTPFFTFGTDDGKLRIVDANSLNSWLTEQQVIQRESRAKNPSALAVGKITYQRQPSISEEGQSFELNTVIKVPALSSSVSPQ